MDRCGGIWLVVSTVGPQTGSVGKWLSWAVTTLLRTVGVSVPDPSNPFAVRTGLHVELVAVMSYDIIVRSELVVPIAEYDAGVQLQCLC